MRSITCCCAVYQAGGFCFLARMSMEPGLNADKETVKQSTVGANHKEFANASGLFFLPQPDCLIFHCDRLATEMTEQSEKITANTLETYGVAWSQTPSLLRFWAAVCSSADASTWRLQSLDDLWHMYCCSVQDKRDPPSLCSLQLEVGHQEHAGLLAGCAPLAFPMPCWRLLINSEREKISLTYSVLPHMHQKMRRE